MRRSWAGVRRNTRSMDFWPNAVSIVVPVMWSAVLVTRNSCCTESPPRVDLGGFRLSRSYARGEAGACVGFGEPSPPEAVGTVTEKERALLSDIATHPIAGVTARYERLGWNAKIGNAVKDAIITSGLAEFENVPTANARIKILTLTDDGIAYLTSEGITVPSWRWGGAAHEYWRETIRQLLERHGYTVTNEYAVQGGYVDLHATKGDHELFVEIETGKSDTNANTEKCKALDGTVVFFFVTELLREEQRDAFAALPTGLLLTPHDLDRLHDSL